MKNISFKVGKDTLNGTIVYPRQIKEVNPTVLFVHGWSSSQTGYFHRAEAVAKTGAICMTFNLRGHGDSDGKLDQFSRVDHLNDVLTAYDYLTSLPTIDKRRVGIVGASYGGYLASISTTKRVVRWLVLRAPALYKDDGFNQPTASLIRKDIQVYRQSQIDPQYNLALKALTTFKNDVLLLECEKDTVVPHQTIENYKQALKHNTKYTYIVLPGADHELSSAEHKELFIDVLVETFTNWLK